MADLPSLTFAEVDEVFREAQKRHPAFAQMSLRDFSRYANAQTQSTAFSAGDSNALGVGIKRASTKLDEVLKPVSNVAGEVGFDLGSLISPRVGEATRGAFEGLPRMGAEAALALPLAAAAVGSAEVTVPMAILGGIGLASTAAKGYTETGSPLAGALQAGTTFAMPAAGRLGTGVATKVARPVGDFLSGLVGKAGSTAVERGIEYAGANVGAGVAGELGSQASSLAAGQGLQNPFTLENLVGNTVGQLPFAAFDVPQLVRGYKPIKVGERSVGVAPVGFRELGRPAPVPSVTEWQRLNEAAAFAEASTAKAIEAVRKGAVVETTVPETKAPLTPAAAPPGVKAPTGLVVAPPAPEVKAPRVAKPAAPAAAVTPPSTTPAPPATGVKLGISRPVTIDPALRQMPDAQFDAHYKTVTAQLDKLEGSDAMTSDPAGLAKVQDTWASADLERYRRTWKDVHAPDVFKELLTQAEGAVKFGPGSSQFMKAATLVDVLKSRKVSDAEILSHVTLDSPDKVEIFKAQLQDLHKVMVPSAPAPESFAVPKGMLSPTLANEIKTKFHEDDSPADLYKKLLPSSKTMIPGRTEGDKIRFLDSYILDGMGEVPVDPVPPPPAPPTPVAPVTSAPSGKKEYVVKSADKALVVASAKWRAGDTPTSLYGKLSPEELAALPIKAGGTQEEAVAFLERNWNQLEKLAGQASLKLGYKEPAMRNTLTGEVYSGGKLHALVPIPGQVEPNALERGWLVDGNYVSDEQLKQTGFASVPKATISNTVKSMETEGRAPEEQLRTSVHLSRLMLQPGEDVQAWIARRAGLDPRIAQEGSPDALLSTTQRYFDTYFRLRGYHPETAQFLTNFATRVAARFGTQLSRVRVARADTGSPNFYVRARAGRWNDVIALAERNFVGRPQAAETLGQMVALGHESFHALEERFALKTLPMELQAPFARALESAATMSPQERQDVISWFTERLVGKEGRGLYDYRAAAYEDPRTGANEFLADFTGLLAVSSTTQEGTITAKDWARFGNAETTGFIQSSVRLLNETIRGIVQWFKQAFGLDAADRRILGQYETIAENLNQILVTAKRADDAALAFGAVADRSFSDFVDYQPTLDRRQVAAYLQDVADYEPGPYTPVPNLEVEAALRDLEEVTRKVSPFGERMSWYHWGYPMSQLAARFPQLKGAVDLGFKHREMAARYIQETWGMHFVDERGKVDRARLRRIGKEGSRANKAFNAAALFQNAEEVELTGKDLQDIMEEAAPGITNEEKRDVEVSLRQFGQMNVQLARQRIQSHRDDMKGAVAGLVMAFDRSVKASAAWDFAERTVETVFNERSNMVGIAGEAKAVALANGFDENLASAIGDALQNSWKGHASLAKKLLGQDLVGKPWWFTEVRLGTWTVAYADKAGNRSLEAFREQGAAEKRFAELEARRAKGELQYVKAFNKADRMDHFRNLQSELIDAYTEADDIYYKSVISKIREKDPDLADEMWEQFRPGMGATRMTTSPYLLERDLQGGRETLNMVAGQVHYVDSTAYGLAKRFVKSRQRAILRDPELMQNEQLKAVAKRYLQAVTDPEGKEFTALKNMVFLHYMGFNPSHIVIEPFQLVSSHVPLLVGHGDGIMEAYGRLGRAIRSVGTSSLQKLLTRDGEIQPSAKGLKGGVTDEDLVDLLRQGRLARVVETGFVSDMFSLEDTDFAATRSMLTGSGKLAGARDAARNSAYWLTQAARKFYGIAPRFNARVALVSSYEQARMRGLSHDDAVMASITATRESMFGGGVVNRPMALHVLGKAQGVGGLLYSLQSYTANMYSFMGRLLHDSLPKNGLNPAETKAARKALLTMGTTQLLLGGLVGFPFIGAAISVWDQLFRDSDVKRNLREAFFKLAGDDEDAGNLLAEGAMGGAINVMLPVADVGSRFQLGTFFGVNPYDGFTWNNLFGPSASLLEAYGKGARGLIEGDLKSAMGMIPAGPRGAIKLLESDGVVRDPRGRMLFEPNEAEKALMIAGFKPRRMTQYYEREAMAQRTREVTQRDRDKFMSSMADLMQEGRFNEVTNALHERQRQLPGMFDARAAAARIAEIVQERRNPRVSEIEGSLEAAARVRDIQRLYPGLSVPGQSAVASYLQRQQLARMTGMQGAGRVSPDMIRRASMVDNVMKQNPQLNRQMAEMLVERMLSPASSAQRFGSP